ncbi:MAG: serine hydrolase [Pirellulaceae bacterium]
MRVCFVFFIAFALSIAAKPGAGSQAEQAQQPDIPARLETFLEISSELRDRLRVPGLGIGLIVDHRPVYVGGLGLRNVERSLPFDGATHFGICSNTKAMTGFVVSTLVAEGKLNWREPIKTYLPELSLTDAYVEKHVTLADACSHMTGLARKDELWKDAGLSRDEVFRQTSELPFEFSLREQFSYNNHMFVLVGAVIECVTGKSWEANIQEKVFLPLGMSDSSATHTAFRNRLSFCLGYELDGESALSTPRLDCVGPAGSIVTTPEDFMRWLEFWVRRGEVGGKRIASVENFSEYERPSSASMVSKEEFKSYWAGWGLKLMDGEVEYRHSGGIDGLSSIIRSRPSDGFGIFVMTNSNTDLKDLLADYADQIFNGNGFMRSKEREENLVLTCDMRLFASKLINGGIEAAESVRSSCEFSKLEADLNAFGYQLLNGSEMDKALYVFKLNTEEHPQSANAWDSLGECFYRMNVRSEAMLAYGRCLELNPSQESAQRMLSRIRKNLPFSESPGGDQN